MSDDADKTERSEAEALAAAPDGARPDPGGAPEPELETAALLRYSAGEGELSAQRADALLDELLRDAPPARAPSGTHLLRFLPWMAAGIAATTVVLLWLSPLGSERGAEVGSTPVGATMDALPTPPPALLRAQAQASRQGGSRAALDAQMTAYRERVLRALDNRYPMALGALETRGAR